MAYFPVFIDIKNMNVLVIGLGSIAARRIKILSDFGAEITVITKEVKADIKDINIKIKEFSENDIKEMYDMVIAATDDDELNKKIAAVSKSKGIRYYNNAGCKEDNNFYFPAVIENDDIICGLISKDGLNHKAAKYYADKLRDIL